jgi:tripartite ATP-independent transporter DctM subunit
MSPFFWGIIGFLSLFSVMAFGVPIGLAMGMVGFLGILCLEGATAALSTVGIMPFSWAADHNFMCIPLFLLMGNFANIAGVITRFYASAYKWFGTFPGGLAITSTIACGAFGAVSGSSSAAAAIMSTICIPEMKKYHYDPRLMTGCIAVGGTLAILIPPSLSFIIYGLITEESIGKLFIAGIIPGIISVVLISFTTWIRCKFNIALGPPAEASSLKEKIHSLTGTWEVTVIFFLVIGGLYMGVFTPTEASGIGAFITFLFAFLRRKLTKENFLSSLQATARITVMIFILIIGAMIFNNFVAFSGIPAKINTLIKSLSVAPYLVLGFILASFFIFGCIMDTLAMMVLLLPIYYPIIISLGFDGIWFGVIVTVMAEIGLLTPPIGLNCFIIHGVFPEFKLYEDIFRGVLPYLIVEIFIVLLLVMFPQICLFLPKLLK